MKKIVNIALIMLLVFNIGYAQNDQGTLDDIGRISLTPVLAQDLGDMPESSQKLFLSKLRQSATKNGLGGTSAMPQFIITGTASIIDKEITETAPPMIAYNLEVNLYIVDYATKTTLSNLSLELKGVGKNENKAFTSALRRINPKSSKVRSFVKKGKNKIIEYYNTQCEMILKQAQALVKVENYEGAIYTLITIPEVCKECHYKALDAIEPIYKKMIGENCKDDLEAAKVALNEGDMVAAKNYLEAIEPGTDCYDKAVDLAKQINNEEPQKRGFNGEVKMQAAAPATREEKVEAYKEVGAQHADKQNNEYDLNFMSDDE